MRFSDAVEIEEYIRRANNQSLSMEEIIPNLLEIKITRDDGFLIMKETLTRIGIPSYREKKLYQTCHILHKRGCYYVIHFKELFMLDGRASTLTEEDVYRRNAIAHLMQQWGFCEGVNWGEDILTNEMILKTKVLSYAEKDEWKLESKHPLGKN